MHRLRLFVVAAAALTLALLGSGTALASTPHAAAFVKCGQFEHSAGDTCVPNVRPIPGHVGRPGAGFDWRHHVPAGFPVAAFNRNLLNLQLLGLVGVDVSTVDVCSYPSWTAFDGYYSHRFGGRWGVVRNHFGPNPAAVYAAMYQAAACSAAVTPVVPGQVVVPSGLSLVRGHYINADAYGLVGAGSLDVCLYNDWTAFDRFGAGRFGGRWGAFRGHWGHDPVAAYRTLRARASCGVAPVVLNQQQVIVPNTVPTTVVQAPADDNKDVTPSDPGSTPAATQSAAPSSGGTVSSYPKGAPETGDSGLAAA